MKKISTITFHASYNYGSCLQAYALQEFIKKISNEEIDYEIINLRTETQKNMYKNFFYKKGLKNSLKKIIFFSQKKNLDKRDFLYEDFIKNLLQVTKEYKTLEELKSATWKSDFYIAGSDQLWNKNAYDFDWANFLEFVDSPNKISYAASFGPLRQNWNVNDKARIKKDLKKFKYISVRENGSYDNVKELINVCPSINVDPTLLLSKSDWEKLISKNRIIKYKYIYLYNLKGKKYFKLAKKISKKLKLPVVISKDGRFGEIFYGFRKKYDVGPLEFINLIANAELVLSSSFHGTIFSIIFNKPFFSLYGAEDLRINTLLQKMSLTDRSINFEDYLNKCESAYEIDFKQSDSVINYEISESKKFLKKALDIK